MGPRHRRGNHKSSKKTMDKGFETQDDKLRAFGIAIIPHIA
jgi:hypothetical protein